MAHTRDGAQGNYRESAENAIRNDRFTIKYTHIPFVNYSSITDPCGGDGHERWYGRTLTLTLTFPLTLTPTLTPTPIPTFTLTLTLNPTLNLSLTLTLTHGGVIVIRGRGR